MTTDPSFLTPEDGSDRFVKFIANPIQKSFIQSQAEADFFSARMGEGKSAGLSWCPFWHTQHNPGATWAMIRDTWENLRDTTQKEFFEWFPPGVAGIYKKSEKLFTWTTGEMRGEIQWLGMDDEKDASKLQSRALGGFGMDEPAPAAHSGGIQAMIFTTAMSRLRQKGMHWYAAKLTANNPDEDHWTYRYFVEPGKAGHVCWQTKEPENLQNLPTGYYDRLRETYRDRPDLIARFADGQFGFQRLGRSVTPAWNELVHTAYDMAPQKSEILHLLWDFGLNPSCIITDFYQGHWRFLESLVGEDVGLVEHIEHEVLPLLQGKYAGYQWDHTHDPANNRTEVSSLWTPVRVLRELLGGKCYPGPVDIAAGTESLNAILSRLSSDGKGFVQVDKHRASHVWRALRGGWHYPERHAGVIASTPVKNIHSHPGDACRYGAGRFFPMGRISGKKSARAPSKAVGYFNQGTGGKVKFRQPLGKVPKHARTIGDPNG